MLATAILPPPSPTFSRISAESLQSAADALFAELARSDSSTALLSYFSRTEIVNLSVASGFNGEPPLHLTGLNGVRSYFDLVATHWKRSKMRLHHRHVCPDALRVVLSASVTWTWKESGKSWREDFTCTLDYDDQILVKGFAIQTESGQQTCLMFAVDPDS